MNQGFSNFGNVRFVENISTTGCNRKRLKKDILNVPIAIGM
jgi:hypothetical protein